MTDQQSKPCSPHTGNVTTYFLERAKHYRLAAAMTENTQEIERLCEVAHMFERMAHDIRRLAPHSRLTAGAWARRQCSLSTDCNAGLIETWVGRVARLRRRLRQREEPYGPRS
jgi:pyridoxine/pyridoxamine 5'-phosphate oxidase